MLKKLGTKLLYTLYWHFFLIV